MKKYQILLVFIVSFSFGFSQDFSKNLTSFKSDSKTNQKEYSFTYKLPTDGYHFQISLDSTVVPVAIYIKYGDQEYFSGFIGQNSHSSFTQNDLTVAEKEKLLKIQPPQLKSTTETRIKSSKPDPLKISGGVEGEKYIIKDVNGTEIAVFKKIGSNLFDFRSKSNVPLIDDYSKENEIIFRKEYVKYVYKELNIDPSVQSLVITQGKERDRVDNGSCVLIDKPSDFYLEYFSELNALPRNFIGELIVSNQEYKLLKEINTSISRVSGKEISILFKNGDELASKNTEKIANGEISYLDGLKNYKNTIESQNKFSFEKKEGIDEITILVFSPLEKSSFTIQLSQSPEGLNQVYYLSGQLKEKYTLIGGKLNGEKISYYEDKNYKIGQDSKPIKEITTYSNGSMTGIHRQYDMSQNLILEEDLKDGVRNGMFKKYSGTKIIEQGNYLNNEKEGEWITQNYGEKITQNYTNGKLNGSFKKYEGEILRESGQYLDGLKNGEWKKFDSYGQVLELQYY
jgi:antitoxin component YwqK of YwqJK toxin-antitoxin module